jgi:hypothetical protein
VKFNFKVETGGERLTLTAERIYASRQAERFRITITGSDYSVILQSNRPAIETKKPDKPVQWHVAEGKAEKQTVEAIGRAIEQVIKRGPKPFQGTLNFINEL